MIGINEFRIVQAQYFHDSDDEELYRTKSIFIAEINNELVNSFFIILNLNLLQKQNDAYKTNLGNLEQLILVKFTADSMVVPRDSSVYANYSTYLSNYYLVVWILCRKGHRYHRSIQ